MFAWFVLPQSNEWHHTESCMLILAVNEVAGLIRRDGKCTPKWGNFDTPGQREIDGIWCYSSRYCESNLSSTATEQAATAKQAADNKTVKYGELENICIFFLVAVETGVVWSQQTIELVWEVGRFTATALPCFNLGQVVDTFIPLPSVILILLSTGG